ncbi:MAG: hypothetical protein QW802_03145 [Candidatus Altiarchaeota archaeon]
MKKSSLFSLLFFILIITFVSADVGLVVEFPDGNVHTSCVNITKSENGRAILEIANLSPSGTMHKQYGFFLKCIKNFCDGNGKFWSFSLILPEKNEWIHSPVGIGPGGDLNNFCWNRNLDSFDGHYCSHDGDVIGFSLNEKFPKKFSFTELCGEKKSKEEILRDDRENRDVLSFLISSIINLFSSIVRNLTNF